MKTPDRFPFRCRFYTVAAAQQSGVQWPPGMPRGAELQAATSEPKRVPTGSELRERLSRNWPAPKDSHDKLYFGLSLNIVLILHC